MATLNPNEIRPRLVDGQAIYELGHGVGQEETVLLLPRPGAEAEESARSKLALILVRLGKRVVTFDPPGQSGEFSALALACLDAWAIQAPVNLVTWGSGAAQALTLVRRHPERVKRLALIGDLDSTVDSVSTGWQAVDTPALVYLGQVGPSCLARAYGLDAVLPNTQVMVNFDDGPDPITHAPIHVGAALRSFLDPHDPRPGRVISVEI